MLALGLLDDLWGLSPLFKLTFQTVIAGVAFVAGVRIEKLAGFDIDPVFSLPLTVFWLLLCTNAFNLIDGMDGLAAGLGFFATTATLVTAFTQSNVPLALLTAPLAGALLGFLRYNAPPASIFLGDSGSLLIGFLLGCYSVVWSQKVATIFGLLAPLMAVALPIVDVTLSVGRRLLRGQPIFQGDRGHIHHMLLRRGFSTRRAVLLLYAAAFVMAVFSLVQGLIANQLGSLVTLLFCAFVWLGIQSLGYVEFRVAYRVLRSGSLFSVVSSQIHLRSIEDRVALVNNIDDCWCVLRQEMIALGFVSATATLSGKEFAYDLHHAGEVWTLNIPIRGDDRLTLCAPFCVSSHVLDASGLVSTLRRCLSERVPAISASAALAAPSASTSYNSDSLLALRDGVSKDAPSRVGDPAASYRTSS